MPIKVNCQCGQSLAVPDQYAGKAVKCPKCQTALKVPAAAGTAPAGSAATKPAAAKPAAPATAKPAAAKPAAPVAKAVPAAPQPAMPAASNNMESLFDEIGLKQQSGPKCPKCGSGIKQNAAICTECGLNFQTGEQMIGFNAAASGPEFKNQFLQEAADHMEREILSGERHAKAGMPWWMLAAFLLGAICVCLEGVVIVDGTINTMAPAGTFLGRVQRQSIPTSMGVTLIAVAVIISNFAHLSIVAFAFIRLGAGQGFGCLMVPFWALVVAIKHWADNKSAVYATIWSMVIMFVAFGLMAAGGGIK
ncbi:MAG: hypothetical protein U0892_07080 [Pirellulales bacterium]